jgi:UDP-N-acetylglucosamine/UDP-N-acetylgalactosamine diphosphorylase
LDFLQQVAAGGDALPWHVAAKKMQVMSAEGSMLEVPGFKFETFVFDALQSSPASITLEVNRDLEFAPVKNKTGEDSPESAQAALGRFYATWIASAGGTAPEPLPNGRIPVEVDPLLAESEEDFLALKNPTPNIEALGHFYGP